MRNTLFFLILINIPAALLADNDIVINEIMYNSDGTDVEYIELYNNSQTAYDLTNWTILDDNDDHTPCVITGTLQPGQYFVIAGDVAQFQQKYPGVSQVNHNGFDTGGTGWALGNGGDTVRLFDASNELHDQVSYDDGGEWPTSPDGNGPSLELLYPALDNSLATSWDPSTVDEGTPGEVNSVYTENVQPTCKDGERSIALPTNTDEVTITVLAFDSEGLATVELFFDTGNGYYVQLMNDSGLNGDASAGDSIYSTIIAPQMSGTLVKYYAVATDNIGQQDAWPNDAPEKYHAYTVDYQLPDLRITEVLAVNNSTVQDEFGDYDDWFEIHNAGNTAVNLGGMFVSDDLNAQQNFELPPVVINPGEYRLVWADDEADEGDLHTDFKFSSGGEAVALFETVHHGNVLIHGWQYGIMSEDVSMGFRPESGTAPEYLSSPTPGATNESSSLSSPVCINEFQATSNFGGTDDWVEIYNRGTEDFDLSGCFLTDQRSEITKWMFPPETVLGPGEFLVIYEDGLKFGFSADGDDVIMLTASDTATGLDFYDFKKQQPDKSEGRFPDGTNTWQRFDEPTKGTSNQQTTGMEPGSDLSDIEFILYRNYPNPFNPTTTIRYSLNTAQHVTLAVYNLNGQLVREVVDEYMTAGTHTIQFDAGKLASGVYFYRISAGKFTQVRKMALIR
jgi:hypothetical protein